MLQCWACELPFRKSHVLRDGILRGRKEEDGGPFRIYECPGCQRPSKVESTAGHRMFASPERELSAMDYLFGWMELLSPTDFVHVMRWQHKYLDARRKFFEQENDHRYSRTGLASGFRQWFGSSREPRYEARAIDVEELRKKEAEKPPEQQHTGQQDTEPQPEREEELPPPYRILGLDRSATPEDIREAFRRLARRHHPDKVGSADPEMLEKANQRFQLLLQAYEELMGDDSQPR